MLSRCPTRPAPPQASKPHPTPATLPDGLWHLLLGQIFALIDDFGHGDIGYHNQLNEDLIRTPALDSLAAAGIKCDPPSSLPPSLPPSLPAFCRCAPSP